MRNEVHIEGVVKRDSEATSPRAGVRLMSFTLAVPDATNDNENVYVDCFAATDAVDMLDGFVSKDELLAVDGQLTFRTMTDYRGRKKSSIVVYVDYVEEIGE